MPQKQADITNAYESIGNELHATVVPAGLAWQRFLAKHDKPALHDADQSHPTVAGTYLAACVFLQTLFARSPAGNKAAIPGLSAEDRTQLQQGAIG